MARKKRGFRAARLLERLTPLTTMSKMRQRVSEAFARGVQFSGEDEPGPGGGDKTKKWGYSPAGRGKTRDVSEIGYREAVEIVWTQYTGNPFARRLNELRRDLILDTEIRPKATDPKVQEVIDRFWDDPVNAMGTFVFQFGLQLGLFGTQVFVAFPSLEEADGGVVGSGLVRLGYIDPGVIEDIILDPENARIPVAVVEDRGTEGKRFYRVVHVDESVESEMAGKLIGVRKRAEERTRYPVETDFQWVVREAARAKQTMRVQENRYAAIRVKEFAASDMTIARKGGSYEWEDENGVPYDGACFLFRVNNVMNSKYGWPDLLHLIDWLDQADMFFFDVAERIFWLTAFVWDVLYAGLDEDEIRERVAMEPAPKRGSIRGHNESVVWTAVAPDLGQADMRQAAELIIWFIFGIGFSIPESWTGWALTSRYAGAKEAVAPAHKVLEARQSYVQSAIKLMVQFQIEQAQLAKQLPEDVDTSFTVPMPEISKADTGSMAVALKTVAEGLMISLAAGLVDRPVAIAIFSKVVSAAGVDVEIKEEMSLEDVKEAREMLRLLQKLEQTEIGSPLKLEDLLDGAEISTEDLKRIRHEWGDFLAIAGIDEDE